MKLPVLMDCTALHARLAVANCVKRYRLAQEGGQLFHKLPSLETCKRCDEGAAHAEAELARTA